jgi:predicted TIM-barrel fold metal-dependent hydrolase
MKNIYDCHTHVFTGKYIPSKFFKEYMTGETRAVLFEKVLKTSFLGINKFAVWILSRTEKYKKFSAFLEVGIMKTQDMVFEDMKKAYPGDTRIVVLPVNFQYMEAGELSVSYCQQVDDLMEVRMRYPNQCLPFIFIDPRMGTAEENLSFVKKYAAKDKGCIGIKLYPSVGYYPYDPRLYKVYEYAEANGIPIITHCSKGGIFYNPDKLPVTALFSSSFNPQVMNKLETDTAGKFPKREYIFNAEETKKFKNNFIRPENYIDVLEKFPKLKLCLAHFGGDSELFDHIDHHKTNTWYDQIKQLITMYPNVYTDISYSLYDKKILGQVKSDLDIPGSPYRNRILYGTDYFMTLQEDHVNEESLFTNCLNDLLLTDFEKIANENNREFLTSLIYTAP